MFVAIVSSGIIYCCSSIWVGSLLLLTVTKGWHQQHNYLEDSTIISERSTKRSIAIMRVTIGIILFILLVQPLFGTLYSPLDIVALVFVASIVIYGIFQFIFRGTTTQRHATGKFMRVTLGYLWLLLGSCYILGEEAYTIILAIGSGYSTTRYIAVRIALLGSSGILSGVAFVTVILLFRSGTINNLLEVSLASRWTQVLGICSVVVLITGYAVVLHRWHNEPTIAVIELSLLLLPCLGSWLLFALLRFIIRDISRRLPTWGNIERSYAYLRVTAHRQATAALTKLRIVTAIIEVCAVIVCVATIQPQPYWWGSLSPRSLPPTALPTATVGITVTPFSGVLTQKNADISVTLQANALIRGQNQLTFTLQDTQGQPLTNARISVVANPSYGIHTGTIIATTVSTTNPIMYLCDITFDVAGTWQLAILVATVDQSLSSSVVFTVQVGMG